MIGSPDGWSERGAGSLDVQHQIGPVERDPEMIEDISAEQDVGLLGMGQDLDQSRRCFADLDEDQERPEDLQVTADSEYRHFVDLEESQLIDQPRRNDGQIGRRIDLGGAFRGGCPVHGGSDRYVDERRGGRDLSVISVAAISGEPPPAPDPRRWDSRRPLGLVGDMAEIKRHVPYSSVRLHGHGDLIRAAGDNLPIVDRDILAEVGLEELRQQFPEGPTLAFVRGFRGRAERQVGAGYSITSLMMATSSIGSSRRSGLPA